MKTKVSNRVTSGDISPSAIDDLQPTAADIVYDSNNFLFTKKKFLLFSIVNAYSKTNETNISLTVGN